MRFRRPAVPPRRLPASVYLILAEPMIAPVAMPLIEAVADEPRR